MPGTTVSATVVRVVDGDTIRVLRDNGDEESLRNLALDTEESNPGSSKPVTPWGHAAKAEAEGLFQPGDEVLLEFPGQESPDICWQKYRGNYGRPLVFLYRASDGLDFQEHMIRHGYSPYFVKYGNAPFAPNHNRYVAAEMAAQQENIGVWNQLMVNGSEVRNYAQLGTWWRLRAQIVDDYRDFKQANPAAEVFDTRLDYDLLVEKAAAQEQTTIFTELRDYHPVAGGHVLISIGSIQQPFQVFIPAADLPPGQAIMNLLLNRYLPAEPDHPRRSYAYISGPLKLFGGRPEILLTSVDQVRDEPA